ncbi:3-hydroxyacyl-CoA dehydrogenase family protein [Chloroflexota bacterium]
MKKVGVVGCGQMGGGIAQVIAQSGYQVVVSEINNEFLEKGLTVIKKALAKSVEKEKITKQDEEAILGRLKGTTDIKDFADCDLIVEAAIEDMAEKKKLFASLDQICPAHTIISSNTSSLSITEMAMATKKPDKVVGLHFFNPVPVMKLVEVVKTILASEESINAAKSFAESLGKTVVLAKDTPGFIVNRLLGPYVFDAIRVYESGAASREDIDQAMALGANHPIGPLSLADLIGLDVCYHIAESMYQEYREARFAPPVLLKRMVTAGHLGRKTGKGFYDYK